MKLAKLNCKVNFIKTKEYTTAAIRPLNVKLSKGKIDKSGFYALPKWINSLKKYIYEINNKSFD